MTFNLNRPESEEKLKSNKLLRFGYLFEENKVNKLKEEINFKAEEKSKNKKDPIKTQQSNKDFYEQSRLHLNNFRARKTMSSFKAYP